MPTAYAASLKKSGKAKAFIDKGIEGIEAEAERASAIVEQVRNYAKNKSSRQNQQDLKEILQEVHCRLSNHQRRRHACPFHGSRWRPCDSRRRVRVGTYLHPICFAMRPKPSLILRVRSRGWKSPTLDLMFRLKFGTKARHYQKKK